MFHGVSRCHLRIRNSERGNGPHEPSSTELVVRSREHNPLRPRKRRNPNFDWRRHGSSNVPTKPILEVRPCEVLVRSKLDRSASCGNLQIIALHDYNLDTNYVASHIDAAKPLALANGKRMLYEEFGATGSNKQSQIQSITNLLISVG